MGKIYFAPASRHHIIVLLFHDREGGTLEALGKGLEHPLACLRGCEEWTHVPTLFLGWRDSQPSKGTHSIFSQISDPLQTPVEPIVWVRHVVSLEARRQPRDLKTNQKNLLWVLSVLFLFPF